MFLRGLVFGLIFLAPGIAGEVPSSTPLPGLAQTCHVSEGSKPECPPGPGPCVVVFRLSATIDPASVGATMAFLKSADDAKAKYVLLELNTVGGDMSAGFVLSRAIELTRATVVCVVDDTAYSMGFYILQSCDLRAMTKRASLMAHQVRSPTIIGPIVEAEARNLMNNLHTRSRGYAEHSIRRMGISLKEFMSHVSKDQDWYMDWEQALAVRAVDMVVDNPAVLFKGLAEGQLTP